MPSSGKILVVKAKIGGLDRFFIYFYFIFFWSCQEGFCSGQLQSPEVALLEEEDMGGGEGRVGSRWNKSKAEMHLPGVLSRVPRPLLHSSMQKLCSLSTLNQSKS